MSKPINICEWEEDFLFYITRHSPRYESLRELERKLVRVIAFLNTLNKNNPNENKAGIEISKFAISYTDKLVEFFGFGDGNTPKPFNFDQALQAEAVANFELFNQDFADEFARNMGDKKLKFESV